jgi:hypothetical protein
VSKTRKEISGTEARETVCLLRHHTHAGVDHAPGDLIAVTPSQAAWLAGRGLVEKGAGAGGQGLEIPNFDP